MTVIPVELASQRRIRDRNKVSYRVAHWPIWIWVFFITPGPLTFDCSRVASTREWPLGWGLYSSSPGGSTARSVAGCRAATLYHPFHRGQPNPLYRRVCYTFAWSAVLTFALLNIAGLVVALLTGGWYLYQIYEAAYFPIAITIWIGGAAGLLPRVKRSTEGEGHERRYFYGSMWAVCLAQPVLWFLNSVLPQTSTADAVKLVVFVSVLGIVGWLSYRGKLPRTRPIVPGELAVSD